MTLRLLCISSHRRKPSLSTLSSTASAMASARHRNAKAAPTVPTIADSANRPIAATGSASLAKIFNVRTARRWKAVLVSRTVIVTATALNPGLRAGSAFARCAHRSRAKRVTRPVSPAAGVRWRVVQMLVVSNSAKRVLIVSPDKSPLSAARRRRSL